MILPTWAPGKITQTFPNHPHNSKETPKQKLLVKGPFGIFQGYVGEILDNPLLEGVCKGYGGSRIPVLNMEMRGNIHKGMLLI